MNNFVKLASINVNDYVEKKNGLSYLSWAYAVDQLMRQDPTANWEFHAPQMFGETMMVSCTVTAFGKQITMHLPVMDHRNAAIKNPDAVQVNKNMMRCLTKAISCHGLGLYIYAGEDMPVDASYEPTEDVLAAVNAINNCETVKQLQDHYKAGYKIFQKDAGALKLIIAAKDAKKAELNHAAG